MILLECLLFTSGWLIVCVFLQVPRDVHPVVWFNATSIRPKLLESFAFDKYELEPSPLTQHILEKRDPNLCWQVVYFSVYSSILSHTSVFL